jgi:hypothetical protein
VCYQSSIDKAKTLQITIPERLIEQTVDLISGPQVQGIQREYRRLLIEQTKKEVERQIDTQVSQYRPYLPILNTVAIFFLLSIINLPIVLITIPIVSFIMYLIKRYGLISIVTVKTDVERIAW